MRELESHLEALKLSGLISSWHDGCIAPGEEWEPKIKENLEKAQIILLLISVDFIKSRYCYEVELTKAIARHQAGNACVIPVILRYCVWKPIPVGDMRLGELQALPKDAKPISKWSDRDEAFTNIAEGLFEKIQQLQIDQEQPPSPPKLSESVSQPITKLPDLEEDLTSEKPRISYHKLRDLLKQGKWKKADQETAERMLEVAGRQSEDWLDVEDIEKFPCKDLKIIDRLWVEASKGQFGFSVQKQIWQKCGSPTDSNNDWKKFGDRVGWRTMGDSISFMKDTFDTPAPSGHYPSLWKRKVGFPYVCSVCKWPNLDEEKCVICGANGMWSEWKGSRAVALFSRIKNYSV